MSTQSHDYEPLEDGATHRYMTEHNNGERTVVLVAEAADGWLVVAVDLPENGYEALAEETVAVCATEDEAVRRAESWMGDHPKGVKPGGLAGLTGEGGGLFG